LRTIVDSLKPVKGEVRWGYGCQIGVYAQHVYTSLPDNKTVLDYLEYNAAAGTKDQQILAIAGALLFRGEAVKKRISVLSGGERARLCLAALLLSQYNILILDEPGNHLDVDTIEALAEALLAYKGTVIFTSHDRHFMKRIASCIIEVRDGHVVNYRGDYESYLYSVNKEIEEGERELAKGMSKAPTAAKSAPVKVAAPRRSEKEIRKEMKTLEKSIAALDDQKKQVNAKLMQSTDAAEALKLHNEVSALTTQLADAENRWLQLQEEVEEA
jgi:ATP-binding cassette, subfamily F, member 3